MTSVAKLAFQDDPEIAAQFNKVLILRATRGGRKAEVVEEQAENEEAGEIDEAV